MRAFAFRPADRLINGGEHDREVDEDLTKRGDELVSTDGVASDPSVVDEDVRAVDERAGHVGDDRARLPSRPTAELGLIARTAETGGHLLCDRRVALDDEDPGHARASILDRDRSARRQEATRRGPVLRARVWAGVHLIPAAHESARLANDQTRRGHRGWPVQIRGGLYGLTMEQYRN